MKCYIQAKGCNIDFEQKTYNSKVCDNKECRRLHVNKIAKEWKARNIEHVNYKQESYKSIFKKYNKVEVKTSKICHGIHCRGNKTFLSTGDRYCSECKNTIRNMHSTYGEIIIYRS